jgi:NAD(P)-dependent dehydrogenase (short-subunit alcohol dehydrogenase family)
MSPASFSAIIENGRSGMRNRVALVTGGGSGIGRASALALAADGFRIGVLGHSHDELVATVADISAANGEAVVLDADIAAEDQMRRAVARLIERFGRLDVVVANAGINGVWAPIDDLTPEEWARTLAVNLTGTIIVVSSINGTRTFTTPGATAYTVTKAGQVAMVQQLALELARHHIRINAVCPGEIDTNIDSNTALRKEDETSIPVIWPEGQVPITGGKPGRSEDVADVIAFLASDKSRHITGSPIWVDGGQGLLR